MERSLTGPTQPAAPSQTHVDGVPDSGVPSSTSPVAEPDSPRSDGTVDSPQSDGTVDSPQSDGTVDSPRSDGTPWDMPPVPDDIREAAARAPDHWLGMVDPAWVADEPPPEWAVIGEWRSGLTGEIEEWRPNEEYRPSPVMLGWPEPSDPVDAAVQLAVTGYGPLEDAVRALSTAEVIVLLAPDGDPLIASGPDGTAVVPVFTSVARQPFAQGLAHDTVAAGDLADRCVEDGTALSVNPAGPAHLVVGADEVLGALRGTPAEDGPATTAETASDPHPSTPIGRTP